MKGISGRWLKTERLIKGSGPFILGVDKKGPASNEIRCLDHPKKSIPQESLAESFPLFGLIDRKPRKQNHRDRVPGQTLPYPLRSLLFGYRSGRQGVVAYDPVSSQGDVGSGGAGLIVDVSESLEVSVEGFRTRVKTFELVEAIKQDGRFKRFAWLHQRRSGR